MTKPRKPLTLVVENWADWAGELEFTQGMLGDMPVVGVMWRDPATGNRHPVPIEWRGIGGFVQRVSQSRTVRAPAPRKSTTRRGKP